MPEKMIRTNYYFAPSDLARLKQHATRTKMDASDHLRRALRSYLDRVEAARNQPPPAPSSVPIHWIGSAPTAYTTPKTNRTNFRLVGYKDAATTSDEFSLDVIPPHINYPPLKDSHANRIKRKSAV